MAKKDYLGQYSIFQNKCVLISFKYKGFMKKVRPITKSKIQAKIEDPDWVIWAAWADRITFEKLKKDGKTDLK